MLTDHLPRAIAGVSPLPLSEAAKNAILKGQKMDRHEHFGQAPERIIKTRARKNVVVMNRFQDDNRFSAIQQILGYWEALRGERMLPKRSELDPRGIENALENAFVLERIAPGIARLRIAGSHLSDLMGMEVRGMPISSFFAPTAREALNTVMEEAFEDPAVVEMAMVAERGLGKPALEARMLLLPMTSDSGDVSRILGCLVAKGEIGRHPRRFDILKTSKRHLRKPLLHHMPPLPSRHPERPVQIARGFAEHAATLDRKSRTDVPYLRLVPRAD